MQVQPQESLGGRMVCLDQFSGAGRDRRGDSILTKLCSQALPNAEEKPTGSPRLPRLIDGPITFVLSTDDVDRHGYVVAADGWVLDSYRKNPVLSWAHDYRHPAIGRAVDLWTEPHRMLAKMEFAPSEFAQDELHEGYRWRVQPHSRESYPRFFLPTVVRMTVLRQGLQSVKGREPSGWRILGAQDILSGRSAAASRRLNSEGLTRIERSEQTERPNSCGPPTARGHGHHQPARPEKRHQL